MRELLAAGCGVGVGGTMPIQWRLHKWKGVGTPCDAMVIALKGALLSNGPLPSSQLLCVDDTLEASALRALSDLAPYKVPAVLLADDPVILGCCR